MKKYYILFILAIICFLCYSQNEIYIIDYFPAPGQHINIESSGTPAAAQKMTESLSSMVSMGSFGGYIVAGFENACVNDPNNPYGIDFTVFGNAFPGSSEAGVIWVMKDENKNGIADDTWCEIAGSKYFHSVTVKNYEVTYFRTESRDVYWEDNLYNSGWIRANSYYTQDYYPLPEFFPQYPQDSVKFKGTRLKAEIDSSDINQIKIISPAFGYADCHSLKQGIDLTLPDNPYTPETEGAGGNPVDISWAVDSHGNYIDIDSVHFVKIVTGNLASVGWIGEISTDVSWIEDVEPHTGLTGKEEMLIIYPYPERILVGNSFKLEASYFDKGRKQSLPILFSSDNEKVLSIGNSGNIIANNTGEAEIIVSAGEEVRSATIKVVVPDSIEIIADFSAVYPGDTVYISAKVYDNGGIKIDVPLQFSSSNPDIGQVSQNNGLFSFNAFQSGETTLKCTIEGFSAQEEVLVKVLSPHDKTAIYFSFKTEKENLLPFQSIEISMGNLNGVVENRQNDYSSLDRPTLFHALVDGLTKAGVSFWFHDDESANGKLYLYSVEKDDLFTYGWGGKSEPVWYAIAWVARLNGSQFLNCFDEIEISGGDTVDLYHVSDITSEWNYSRLLTNKNTAGINEEVKLTLEQTECTYDGFKITESGFIPLVNKEITVTGGQSYFTDDDGVATVIIQSEPPVVYSSGNNAIVISGILTTSHASESIPEFKVYPNPVSDELTVICVDNSGYRLFMYDINGRIIYKNIVADHIRKIDVSEFKAGIYYLVLVSEDRSVTSKIIKK
jgi:hypothetical protein